MAKFEIDTTDARDETVEADYVQHSDGHFEFSVTEGMSSRTVFIIREAYVRAIRRVES